MFSSTPVPSTTLQFGSERQLQDYCLAVLKSKNIAAREEVWCGNVRADIVTDRAVLELKKVLDRASIYQAYGQVMLYQRSLNKAEVWIVGQTPIDAAERAIALTVAREISARNVKVSFIESDPFWRMRSSAVSSRFNFLNRLSLSRQGVAMLLMILIAFIASSIGFARMRLSQGGAVTSGSSVAAVPTPIPLQPVMLQSPGVRLRVCGSGSAANFRRSPSLADSSVFGVLQVGDLVQPTGQIVQADGVNWVEAIAPDRYPNQVGWIAQCFFGE